MAPSWKNKLYFGDNLKVLREEVSDESVDLVYLDPPFNSAATYNVLFRERSGEESGAQITAFEDTWHWGLEAEAVYHEVVTAGGKLSALLQAFRASLGQNDMMAYLAMMAPRLQELHRVLKPTGSLYLHCDPTASHYLKLVLDAVFGPDGFRNEIVWRRTPFSGSSKARAQQLPRSHDLLLFYTKGDAWTWHAPSLPYTDEYLERFRFADARGHYRKTLLKTYSAETLERLRREDRLIEPTREGANYSYKQYLHESSGTRQVDDVWVDVNMINPVAKERLGYPTQKPEALLERVITASTNEGDLVLDPFCGCGTTVSVAERMHRRWIGIDITHLAVSLIRHRLQTAFGSDLAPYEVLGAPTDAAGAAALALEDRHQFEWWALGLVEARPGQDKKKGADSGVDGLIYFFDDTSGQARKIVVQVKSGHVGATLIRDLKGVIEREKAALGVFVTLEEPTGPMEKEAASAGFYEPEHFNRRKFPRLQVLTIAELLAGKEVQYPRIAPAATFKVAEPKTKQKDKPKQLL